MTTASSADHPTRRDFLFVATGAVAGVGAVATAWPFISQMNPDASTIAAGAPIEVDLTPIAEGQDIKVFWRGKPIYISHRTKKQVEETQKTPLKDLPDPQTDQQRTKPGHEQWLVVVGICTHFGCIPIDYTRLEGYNPDAALGLGCDLPTEFAKIEVGDTFIDLGSGAGNDAFVARKIAGDKGKIISIDFTDAMIPVQERMPKSLG